MTSKTSDFARFSRATPTGVPSGSHLGAPLISRKDTIIIAMLVNIALLVVLFATASRRQETEITRAPEIKSIAQHVVDAAPVTVLDKTKRKAPVDEIDEILAQFAKEAPKTSVGATKTNKVQSVQPEYYIIKSGDSPWKIARKYHIDFDDLLKLNDLNEEKAKNLKIGQKIRIR